MWARALVVAALLVAAAPAHAEPGDELTVSVVTFGPGDHPFFKFGHNAIWIRPASGEGTLFNFGTFAFDTPGLIPKFLRGRLTYWLSAGPAGMALYNYQATNRTIEVQDLNLTPAQRQQLLERLQVNALPANRDYLYDYFTDNCSTRVRDAIDGITGGKLHAAGTAPGRMTLRGQALRMTADLPWEFVALGFGLGRTTDRPITRWQESFLPVELRDLMRTVRLDDGAPLVKAERVLFQATRPAPAERAPSWFWGFLLVGVVVGGALMVLGRVPVVLGVLSALLGFVLGLLGLILFLVWVATNHQAAHANANILQAAPWALALVPLGIRVALGRSARGAFLVAASAAALSLLGLLVKVLPGVSQDNAAFIALLLPLWSGMALGLRPPR